MLFWTLRLRYQNIIEFLSLHWYCHVAYIVALHLGVLIYQKIIQINIFCIEHSVILILLTPALLSFNYKIQDL